MNEKNSFVFSDETVKRVRLVGAKSVAMGMSILFLTMFIPRGDKLLASLCLLGVCGILFAAELLFELLLTAKSTAGKLTMGTLLAVLMVNAGYLICKAAALALF